MRAAGYNRLLDARKAEFYSTAWANLGVGSQRSKLGQVRPLRTATAAVSSPAALAAKARCDLDSTTQTTDIDFGRVAQDLQLKRKQIEAAVALFDQGNTVPFITRYRKEQTGGLDEVQLRAIQRRVGQLRQLAERRQTILRSIESQGKLTDALRQAILEAPNPRRLEDLYMPYKPRKQTLATIARQRGLGPLAEAIWNRDAIAANLAEILPGVVDPEKQLNSVDDVIAGLKHIIAEFIADCADARDAARRMVWQGKIASSKVMPTAGGGTAADVPTASVGEQSATDAPASNAAESDPSVVETDEEGEVLVSFSHENQPVAKDAANEFRNFFDYSEPVEKIPPHRILALNRGEKLGVLKLRIECDRPGLEAAVLERLQLADHPHREFIASCASDAIERLMIRSLEREVRSDLTDFAEDHAVGVFVKNLRSLLLQPPLHGRRVLAIDPGYRTGCKFAVLDEYGNMLEHGVMFPHASKSSAGQKQRWRRPTIGGGKTKLRLEPGDHAATFAADLPIVDESAATPPESPEPQQPQSDRMDANSSCPPDAVLTAESVHRSTPEGESVSGSELENLADALPATGQGEVEPAPAAVAAVVAEPAPSAGESVAATETSMADANSNDAPTAPTPLAKKSKEKSPTDRPSRNISPAWFGVVLPTPDDMERRLARKQKIKTATADGASTAPAQTATGQLSRKEQVKRQIGNMCKKLNVGVIAIGNGTACRETEEIVAELLGEGRAEAEYVIVNEAGASVYSTGAVGREEFPQHDATTRGTISIGRRLQDPLSELVKIDPHSLGVGLYQHDVGMKRLRESLAEVVESCVNFVGVDLNTASASLLQYVAGMNQARAKSVVEYRTAKGPFTNREQLKDVPGIGPVVFTQAAGFLRIPGGEVPLDATWIHPESYEAATKVLAHLGFVPQDLLDKERLEQLKAKLIDAKPAEIAAATEIGEALVAELLRDLARPGRDPRDDLPPPVFKKGILKLEDLQEKMSLKGTVLNVVDFGAFVDIGLKDSGLVHISQLANRFIRSPHEVVAVGDVVTVWVLAIDRERRRVSLTMIEPGTDRPPEQRQPPRRADRRPPRRPQAPTVAATPAVTGQATPPAEARGERRNDRPPPRSGGRPAPHGQPRPVVGQQGPQGSTDQAQRHGQGQGQRRYGQQQGGGPRGGHRQGGGRPVPKKPPNTTSKAMGGAKPRPQPKPPALSPDALSGKEDLRSFGELKEFFKAKKPPQSGDPPQGGAKT